MSIPKIEVGSDVLRVARDAIRQLKQKQELTEAQYDALLHLNALLQRGQS